MVWIAWNRVYLGSGLDYPWIVIILALMVSLAIALYDDFLRVGCGSKIACFVGCSWDILEKMWRLHMMSLFW